MPAAIRASSKTAVTTFLIGCLFCRWMWTTHGNPYHVRHFHRFIPSKGFHDRPLLTWSR